MGVVKLLLLPCPAPPCCDLTDDALGMLGRPGDGSIAIFRLAAAAAGEETKPPGEETASFPFAGPVLSSAAFGVSPLSTLTLNVTPSRRSASLSSTCWFGTESVGGVAQTAGMGA